jgi:fumarylacetoacetate (FAA) hydrolase
MKLATYKDGSRDGQLLVVSRDLSSAHYATGIANHMQQVLDDWNFMSPQLQDLYHTLNQGKARHAFSFEPRQCMAPLPRAYQRASALAYQGHANLLAQAGLAPEGARSKLLMFQSSGDDLLGPCDKVWCASEAQGIDFEAGLAVIAGDVRQGATPAQALDGIRLIMLANQWQLRQVAQTEQSRGQAVLQSQAACAFSPVAVTPDELGAAWEQGRVNLTLQTSWNGRKLGMCEAGPEMTFHFGQLLAHLGKTRNLRSGTIVGSGPVSNQERSRGCSCLVEKRAQEILQDGQAVTEFMKWGDTVRIEMKGSDGLSIFGAIDQEVASLHKLSEPD